ncbi:MAG: sulfotransferase [Verrucomicrobiae bacterium]|nr:sulfotransferase [Verrucomicrobiae bacterium]
MPVLHIGEAQLSRLSADIDTSHFRPGKYSVPDFLIIGPQRTGSSWLRTNLCKHPQVFMPFKKEIFFFSHLRRKDHKRYRSNRLEPYFELFNIPFHKKLERSAKAMCSGLVLPSTIRGEATASYATMPETDIANIFALNPAMRIIIMVRDPAQRSWSHAKKTLVRDQNKQLEDVPFEEFERCYRSKSNIERGTYSALIERWRSFCKDGALYIAEYRKLCADPLGLITETQNFLEIASGRKFARRHLNTVVNPTSGDVLPPQHSELLGELFADEVRVLERDYGIKV